MTKIPTKVQSWPVLERSHASAWGLVMYILLCVYVRVCVCVLWEERRKREFNMQISTCQQLKKRSRLTTKQAC